MDDRSAFLMQLAQPMNWALLMVHGNLMDVSTGNDWARDLVHLFLSEQGTERWMGFVEEEMLQEQPML